MSGRLHLDIMSAVLRGGGRYVEPLSSVARLFGRFPEAFSSSGVAGPRRMRQLLKEIVGSQHYRSFSLDWPFEELTRCSLLNRVAQPHKLIYSLICPRIMLAFKIVHRSGADRTPHCLALIKHREINDHPIEVVAQYFPSL